MMDQHDVNEGGEMESLKPRFSLRRKKMHKGVYFWTMAVLFLLIGLIAGNTIGKRGGAFAASNTSVLTQGGYDYALDDYSLFLFIQSSSMFEKFVEQVITRAEAETRGIKVTDPEIDKFVAANMVDKDGRNRYEQYKELFDEKTIRKQIMMQIMEDKLVEQLRENIVKEQKLEVTEKEAKDYYLANLNKIHKPERVEVSLFSAKTLEKAQEALKQFKAGSDFNEYTAENGDIPELAEQGGYLGVVAKGDLEKIFKTLGDTAFALNEGQYSDVIRGEHHFHIIFVHRKIPAFAPTFDEIKQDLLSQMLEAKLAKPMSAAYNKILERGFDTVSPKVKLLEPKKPTNVEVPATQ